MYVPSSSDKKWKYKGEDKEIYIHKQSKHVRKEQKKIKELSMNHIQCFWFNYYFYEINENESETFLVMCYQSAAYNLSNTFIIIVFCCREQRSIHCWNHEWGHKMVRLYLIVS